MGRPGLRGTAPADNGACGLEYVDALELLITGGGGKLRDVWTVYEFLANTIALAKKLGAGRVSSAAGQPAQRWLSYHAHKC